MRGKERVLYDRMGEIERAAGVDLLALGRGAGSAGINWEKYNADQETLASVNPEYKALRDEHTALRNKRWDKKKAREGHARELWQTLLPVLDLPSLTAAQKNAMRVALELLWQCKPATVKRAENTTKKRAAAAATPGQLNGCAQGKQA